MHHQSDINYQRVHSTQHPTLTSSIKCGKCTQRECQTVYSPETMNRISVTGSIDNLNPFRVAVLYQTIVSPDSLLRDIDAIGDELSRRG
jgi:hypothetical protein